MSLSKESLDSLIEQIEMSDAPEDFIANMVEGLRVRHSDYVPKDVDVVLHRMVAEALGARVEEVREGFIYIDENGKSNGMTASVKGNAWLLSQEDWTRKIRDANMLFTGVYVEGANDFGGFSVWHLDELGLDAKQRCELFLKWKAVRRDE